MPEGLVITNVTEEELKQESIVRELKRTIPVNNKELPRFIYALDQLPVSYISEPDGPNGAESSNDGDEEGSKGKGHTGGYAPIADSLLGLASKGEGEEEGEGEGESEEPQATGRELDRALQAQNQPEPEPEHRSEGEGEGQNGKEIDARVVGDLEQFALTAGFTQDELSNAMMPLRYDEGFPVLPDGRNFWSRLPFEPVDAYEAFSAYLHYAQVQQGPRLLEEMPDFIMHHGGPSLDLRRVQLYYHLYYWGWRAKAYDQFVVQSYRRRMEYRMIQTLDEHYEMADELTGRLMEYLRSEEEFWDVMSPKVAIDLLGKITQLKRVSSGMPANAPPNEGRSGGGGSTNVEVRMRSGSGGGAGTDGDEVDLGGGQSLQQVSQEALKDPETAQLFQELIIKLNTDGSDGSGGNNDGGG